MKLSELMRKTASTTYDYRGKYYGGMYVEDTEDSFPMACAVGGVCLECGWNPEDYIGEGIKLVELETGVNLDGAQVGYKSLPPGVFSYTIPPIEIPLESALILLYDQLKWSKLEIADWLERQGM